MALIDALECHACGKLQRMQARARCSVLRCVRCRSALERTHGRSLTAALACVSSALLLLIPANLMPFLSTSVLGAARESWLASSATAMLGNGFPELAIVVGLFLVVFPLVHVGLLTAVLGALQIGRRPRWIGPAFRLAQQMQPWAMADVFLLGFAVAWARLQVSISVDIGPGAICFVAAALLILLARATLDTGEAWRAIGPGQPVRPGQPLLACGGCKLLLPATMEGQRCPRCAARLHARRPAALARATALTLAAALLYVPANLYPMATLPVGFSSVRYTVLEGVIELVQSGLDGLALLVFVASFAIPLLKLAGMAWLIASVLRRSQRRLVAKTRLYGAIEEIGRWSMIDPFVIACFVPVTHYNAIIHGSAEPAAPLFAAVVILTTLAARSFDPRLLWDQGAAAAPRPALASTPESP